MKPDIPIPIWASLCSAIGGFIGVVVANLWQEHTKRLDREFNEKEKEKDREIAERYKQLDRDAQERSQRLDLYKVIYPAKVQAVKDLMLHAATLHRDVWQFVWNDATDARDEAIALHNRAWDLLHEAQAQEWLLGVDVKAAVTKIHQLMVAALSPKIHTPSTPHVKGVFEIDENTWEPVSGYNAAFEVLHRATVHELQIEELRGLLGVDTVRQIAP